MSIATCGLTAYHLYTNNWIAANIIALAFCFNAISLLKIDSFKTGIILLSGLFFYDIYWVFFSKKQFGQSVMVSLPLGNGEIRADQAWLSVGSSSYEF